MPLLIEPLEVGAGIPANAGKRNKRFYPYAAPKTKRKPKSSTTSTSTPTSPTDGSGSPYPVVPTGFSDPNMAMLQHAHYAATYGDSRQLILILTFLTVGYVPRRHVSTWASALWYQSAGGYSRLAITRSRVVAATDGSLPRVLSCNATPSTPSW